MSVNLGELTITEGEGIPANPQGRAPEPNPFDGHFPTAENKTLLIDLTGTGPEHDKAVEKVRSLARKAAAKCDPPMTARVHAEPIKAESGKNKGQTIGTHLTIWTRAKVTQTRTANTNGEQTDTAKANDKASGDAV